MRPTHIRDYQMIQKRIKKSAYILLLGLSALFVACEKMVDDPEGTVEDSITMSHAVTFNTGNLRFTLQWDLPENFAYRPFAGTVTEDGETVSVAFTQISLCDLGSLKGLGDVSTIPTSGFSAPYLDASQFNTSFGYTPGHGYIFKVETLTRSINPTPTGEVYYVRLYVKESIVSKVLGVFGAKLSYQFPFEP